MTTQEFARQIFPDDFCVQRKYVPWYVFSCCLALTGTMLFGMFFGKNEALAFHSKERGEIVQSFTALMTEKDAQNDKLTKVLISSQRLQNDKLDKMDDTVQRVAIFLSKQGKAVGMSQEDIALLEDHITTLQQQLLDIQAEKRRLDAKR